MLHFLYTLLFRQNMLAIPAFNEDENIKTYKTAPSNSDFNICEFLQSLSHLHHDAFKNLFFHIGTLYVSGMLGRCNSDK